MNDLAPKRYVCHSCGHVHRQWVARCAACQRFGVELHVETTPPPAPPPLAPFTTPHLVTVTEQHTTEMPSSTTLPIPISDVPEADHPRDETGIAPLDAVLGGGLVIGSVVVLGAEPGTGKSSLSFQMLSSLGIRCLYATGEETVQQAALNARRVGAASSEVMIVAETDLDTVLKHARDVRARVLAIDSIQTLVATDLDSGPGSPGQVRACANRLVQFAKTTDTTVWIIGHVTNDGVLAGPKTLKHLVDVVLDLEAGAGLGGNERILRSAGKNRFGPTNVVGRFELTPGGLVPIDGDGWDQPL